MAAKKTVNKTQRGRDLAGSYVDFEYCGKSYRLVANNHSAMLTEAIYEEKFGRDMGFYDILAELQVPKHRAIMAFIYGMLSDTDPSVTWDDFVKNFKLTDITEFARLLAKLVTENMPKVENDDDGNPTTEGETTISPGLG